jgi:Fe2+ transport system protein FeoA
MTSLAHLAAGARATVRSLPHGHGLARRLVALGLNPGAEVYVLQNRGHGPLIVEVHGARLALGRGQADRVAVEPVVGSPCAADQAAGEPADQAAGLAAEE